MNELQTQFGKVVRRRRLEASLLQKALSERAGLQRTDIALEMLRDSQRPGCTDTVQTLHRARAEVG